jgi:DNA-binding HxlR family transcriptional regulator
VSIDPCPISRTVKLLGGRWTPLVLRELFYGRHRFDQIQRSLGISRATLADRLTRLERDGVVERTRYEEHPPRFEYVLTAKGQALWPVLAAMWAYGSERLFHEPTPGMLIDRESGAEVHPVLVDAATGRPLHPRRTRLVARLS